MAESTAPTHISETSHEVAADFLAYYTGNTRSMYAADLRMFFAWCEQQQLDPLHARRSHVEAFARHLEVDRGNTARSIARRFSVLRGYYRLAVDDDHITKNPAALARLPKWRRDPDDIPWLTESQMARMIHAAATTSPAHHALVAAMGTLGMRVSEACSILIENLGTDQYGYMTVTFLRKGGFWRTRPVPAPLQRAFEAARGDRTSGPLILTKAGNQQNRMGAYRWVKILARKAGLPDTIRPHSFRHGSMTALANTGASVYDVMTHGDHRDMRVSGMYFRRNPNPDADGGHVLAARLAAYTAA
jgi:integrase/recombinase XerD